MVGVEFYRPAQESLFEPASVLYAASDERVMAFEGDAAVRAFARIVRDGAFCALDAKHALQEVYPADGAQPAAVELSAVADARYFDIGLAAYLLDSNTSRYEYEALCDAYLGAALPEFDAEDARAAAHAWVARPLSEALREALDEDGSLACYADIDAPLVSTLAGMERVGAALDSVSLAAMGSRDARRDRGPQARDYRAWRARNSTWIRPNSSAISCSRYWAFPRARRRSAGFRPMPRPSKASRASIRLRARCCATASCEDAFYLYRCVAAHARGRRPRAHELQPDGHHHGPPFFERAESAEHSRAHRVRPPHPRMLRAAA